MSQEVLLVHAAATLALTGLVWFVQIVHYPLLGRVSAHQFPRYLGGHLRRSALVVGPLMLAEVITAVMLVNDRPDGVGAAQAWLGFLLVFMIWLSTATLQIPQYQVLEQQYDEKAHELLTVTNWIRTCAWTARSVLVLGMLNGSFAA